MRLLFLFFTLIFSLHIKATTNLWFIHNSADTFLQNISVSLDAQYQISNLGFRQQKSFIIDSNFVGQIIITSSTNPLVTYSLPIQIDSNKSYIVFIQGLTDPANYANNPNGSNTALNVTLIDESTLPTISNIQTRVLFCHGGTDFPTTDISQYPGALVVDNLAYDNFVAVVKDTTSYNINLLTQDSSLLTGTFKLNLKNYPGKTVLAVMSGFLAPIDNNDGEFFNVYLVNKDSLNFQVLNNITTIKKNFVKNIGIYPNPAKNNIQLKFLSPSTNFNTYKISDLNGKILLESLYKGTAIDVSTLAKGSYILQYDNTSTLFNKL